MAVLATLLLVAAAGASPALAAGGRVIESRGHLITLEEAQHERGVKAFEGAAPGTSGEKPRGALCDLSVTNETGDFVQIYLGDTFIGYAWPWGTTRGLFVPATMVLSARSQPQQGPSLAWSTSPFTCEGSLTWKLSPADATTAAGPPAGGAATRCTTPMSAERMARARQAIAGQVLEQGKLSVAESVAATNCLLVEQVREIMKLFVLENFALEFAKFAYDHTVDREDYYTLSSHFVLAQHSQELADYIRSRQ